MTERGLLTDREREIIEGKAEVSDSYKYRVVSRVRKKIKRTEADARILKQYHEDLFDELQESICENELDNK